MKRVKAIKRTFEIGKVDYTGNGRKSNLVTINAELKINNQPAKQSSDLKPVKEYYTFSCSADIWNSNKSDCVTCGQILDEVKELFLLDELVFSLHKLWKQYHLNDIKAGTDKQQACLDAWKERPSGFSFTEDKEHLLSKGLLDDRGYRFGNAWLVNIIPEKDAWKIRNLLEH